MKSGVRLADRLTPEEKHRIQDLRRQGIRCAVIAQQFGITLQAVSKVARGRRW